MIYHLRVNVVQQKVKNYLRNGLDQFFLVVKLGNIIFQKNAYFSYNDVQYILNETFTSISVLNSWFDIN